MRKYLLSVCVATLSLVSSLSFAARTETARSYDVVKVKKERNPKVGVNLGFNAATKGLKDMTLDLPIMETFEIQFLVKSGLIKASRIENNGAIYIGLHGFYASYKEYEYTTLSTNVTPFGANLSRIGYSDTENHIRPSQFGGALRATFHYKVFSRLDVCAGIVGGVMYYKPRYYGHTIDYRDERIVLNEDVERYCNLLRQDLPDDKKPSLDAETNTVCPYIGGIIGLRLKLCKVFGLKAECILGKYTPYFQGGFFFDFGKTW